MSPIRQFGNVTLKLDLSRTLPLASDHFVHFTPGENLSPFNEDHAVEVLDPTNVFHSIGTDPQTGLPGFASRLADKTKIKILTLIVNFN